MPRPAIPEHIGFYRVEGHLGSGGMGEVYLAFDHRLKRRVAIKTIRHDVAMTAEGRERFRREAQAAARLNHPSAVQVYDVVFGESSDAIVMELVEGETLDRLLVAGDVDGVTAMVLAGEIADALAAAHAQGLDPCDLKLENVMVTPSGRAKVLDFGLAKEIAGGSTLTADGIVVVTCRARSPEQARGQRVDARSDLFSFGVLCYEMFTGYSPFRGETVLETLRNVAEHRPTPPGVLRPELPGELASLIERLLEKDPARRPRSADQIGRTLARLCELPAIALLPPARGSAPKRLAEASTAALTGPLPGARARPAAAAGEIDHRRSERRPPALPAAPPPAARGRRWRRLPWVAAVLAAMAIALFWLRPRGAAEPLRVLVLPPAVTVEAGEEEPQLLAFGVAAAVSTLASFEGLVAVDPSEGPADSCRRGHRSRRGRGPPGADSVHTRLRDIC